MSDNLIKILINNVYHGFFGIIYLTCVISTSNTLSKNPSSFGWFLLVFLSLMFLYNLLNMKRLKIS